MDFIWLLFAHYIGDIALQSSWQADNKGKYWYIMLSHCMIWTGCVSVALEYLSLLTLGKIAFLLVWHFISDSIKARQPQTPKTWWMIYPDQLFHIFQLVVVFFT